MTTYLVVTGSTIALVRRAATPREAVLKAFRTAFFNRGTEAEVFELGEPTARFRVTHADVELTEDGSVGR